MEYSVIHRWVTLMCLSFTVPDIEEEIVAGDVQKKMIPWRAMLPQNELELDYQNDYAQKKQTVSEGLVLVTSLIDKLPNLGGEVLFVQSWIWVSYVIFIQVFFIYLYCLLIMLQFNKVRQR